MSTAATLIRSSRRNRGLTQQQLAERSGIDQGNISRLENGRDADFSSVQRLLTASRHRLIAVPTLREDAATIAGEIRLRLRTGDRARALRALLQLNDNLVAEHGLLRGALALNEPEPTREAAWDAALAGLVEWRLREDGLPLPDWVDAPSRHLPRPRPLDVDPADPSPPRSEVPVEFLRRGVLVWRDTFVSV